MEQSNTEMTTKILIQKGLQKAMSYKEYIALVKQLAEEGKSTGPEQTEALTNYTQLNDRRMKRWDKTLKFSEEAVSQILKVDTKITWLVLTESWCGAQDYGVESEYFFENHFA